MKLKLLLIAVVLLGVCGSSFGQVYNQITLTSELTNGDYLIVGDAISGTDGMMLNTVTATTPYINYTDVTNPGATISTGFTSANVFTINLSGGNLTIYNSNLGYVSWGRPGNSTANSATFFNGTVSTTEQWTPTVTAGFWTLANVNTAARLLQWNPASPRFAAYTSIQTKLKLYKLASPTLSTSTTTFTGFTYATGSGPSTSQTFNVSGANLTGFPSNITVTGSTNYEVSTDNSSFGASRTVAYTAATLASTPIYVRLKTGLTTGNYNGETISISGGGATTVNITCDGSVVLPYYRSRNSGNWATASNWESSADNSTWATATAAPTNTVTSITILDTHNITVSTGTVTTDDLTIASGGTLTISGGTFILNNGSVATDLQVNGTLTYSIGTFTQGSSGIAFGANAIYNHSIATATLTLPVATWNVSSTCNVTGFNASAATSGNSTLAQAFGNFTWNCAGQSGSGYLNIQQSGFSVAGTLTVGPSANNLLSFGNSGTFTNTVNRILVSGGLLNCAGGANVNLTVTNDISVTGTDATNYGTFAVSGGSGTASVDIGTDLSISGSGYVIVLRTGSSPSATLRIRRDLLISGSLSPQINLEYLSTSGVATVTIDRDFICTSTTNPAVDFGTGTVTGNIINIGRNFSKSGNATFQTTSSSAATGFSFNGTGTQTFSYSGTNSDFTSYIVQNGATLQLNSNLTLGTGTNPPSLFTVAGTLNFGTNSIIGNPTARFITNAGATLITSNTNGLGGTSASGSLQSFGSVGTASAAGRAVFIDGTNYTFNGVSTTPFPRAIGSIGSAATINVNADVTSNYAAALAVTTALNINGTSIFKLNPVNNNYNIVLSGVMTIASGATFDNNGSNQITSSGTPSIIVNGTFITRDPQGFVGSNTAIPAITPTLNSGCTIEYGTAGGSQVVQGGRSYYNLIISNGGTKTLSSSITNANTITGTVIIKDASVLNVGSFTFGGTGTNLKMTGTSEYQTAGTGTKPDADGTYELGVGTKVTFTSGSIASPINTLQAIRISSPTVSYYNIDIVGNNVGTTATGTTGTNIKIQSGGTFTVKSTGTFKHSNSAGFTGSTTTAVDNTNAPTITLETGSTIEYAGANQTITPFTNTIVPTPIYTDSNKSYSNLTLSGTGTKTIATSSEILVGNELSVTAGTLQIDSNKLLTVNNAIKNTSGNPIIVQNSGNLMQVTNVDNAATNANTGNIKMTRTSRNMQNAYDYVYWGSPVKENVFSQIPASYNATYQWDLNGGIDGSWKALAAIVPGRGFITRVKQGGTGATNFDFTGTPNNGTVTVFADGYTDTSANVTGNTILLANPYPSAIDATTFVAANGLLDGNLYFWTSITAITGNTYSGGDYASWNSAGGTGTKATNDMSGNDNLKPSGKIAAGQGFFADFTGDGNVTFNNTMRMRTTADNSQFFKTTKPNKVNEEKSRVWLNLSNNKKAFRQMLVAYLSNATNGLDRAYDAESFTANEIDIYSILEDKNLVIQGRALPLEDTDVVPLGVTITSAGEYTISIDEVDGQMTDKPIFIEDKVANLVHNLKNTAYSFNIGSGTFNNRFVLRYTDKTLGTTDFDSLENQVLVSLKNKQLKVNSKVEPIDKVTVYDLLGRQLFKKEKVNSNEITLSDWGAIQQIVIVKVSLQNGNEVAKKVMF
jgi:hypothetical protein